MTNVEKIERLYAQKRKDGLVAVNFVFKPSVVGANIEDVAGEILRIDEVIAAGRVYPLDFGDLRWKRAEEGATA